MNIPISVSITYHDVLYHLKIQRRHLFRTACGIFCIMTTISIVLPNEYTSYATLAILPAPEFSVKPDAGEKTPYSSTLATDQVMKAETELLGSRELLAEVISRANIKNLYPDLVSQKSFLMSLLTSIPTEILSIWRPTIPDRSLLQKESAIDDLATSLTVLPSHESNIISLSLSHRDPYIATKTLALIIKVYAEQRESLYRDPQIETLSEALANTKKEAASAQHALSELHNMYGISDLAAERDLLLRQRDLFEQDVTRINLFVAENTSKVTELRRQIIHIPTMIPYYIDNAPDTRAAANTASLATLRTDYAAASRIYRTNSIKLSLIRNQISSLEQNSETLSTDSSLAETRHLSNPTTDALKLDLARSDANLTGELAKLPILQSELQIINDRLTILRQAEPTLIIAEHRCILANDST